MVWIKDAADFLSEEGAAKGGGINFNGRGILFVALGGGVLRGHVDVDSSIVNYWVGGDGIVSRVSCRGGTSNWPLLNCTQAQRSSKMYGLV